MMKKSKSLFITALVTLPLIAACSQTIYHPEFSYPGDPLKTSKPSGYSDAGDGIDRTEFNMHVYFYLDYSHSDEPIYEMKWYMLAPLEKMPEDAKLNDNEDAPDPLYWKFLGYSEYPSCLDESLLWNFETDYKQSNVLKLYGIWVAK